MKWSHADYPVDGEEGVLITTLYGLLTLHVVDDVNPEVPLPNVRFEDECNQF